MSVIPILKTAALPQAGRLIRLLMAAAGLSAALAASALAGSADGTITKIDPNSSSLTLSNGRTYKLPGEFDYSGFHAGQKVSVFYDRDPSGTYVTDIEVQGANAADTQTPADDNEGDGLKGEGADGATTGPTDGAAGNGGGGANAGGNAANGAASPAGQ